MQVAKFLLPSESANTIKLHEFLPVWWFMAGGLVVAGMVYALIPDSKALKN